MFNNKFTKKDSIADAALKILESWDDDEDDDVKRADAELRRMKAKPIEADKKTDPDKEIGKLAKKTPKEVDESVEQIDELSVKTMGSYMQKSIGQKLAGTKDRTPGMQKAYKKMTTKKVSEDKWTDIADGPWKKSKKKTSGQFASAAANAAGKGLKGAQHKLDVAEPKGKLTAADFKKLRKEDAEQIDELSKNTLGSYVKKSSDAADKHLKLANSAAQRSKTKADTAQYMKHSEKFGKRIGGIVSAKNKLAREDVDLSEKTLTPAESKKKEEIVKSMKKDKASLKARYGKRWKEVAYATATKSAKRVAEDVELNESHYADMSHAAKELVLHADNDQHLYHSSHVPIMNNLRKKMKKGEYHPEKAKKLWAYHADRAAQSYAKHHGDGTPWHKMFSTADRKAAASHFEDMHRHELNESKGPTSDYGLETFATNPTNESTPLNKAKIVAKAALSKIKNEMLGKAGATSEEIDPRIKTSDTLKGRVKTDRDDDVGPKSVARSHKVKFTPGPK